MKFTLTQQPFADYCPGSDPDSVINGGTRDCGPTRTRLNRVLTCAPMSSKDGDTGNYWQVRHDVGLSLLVNADADCRHGQWYYEMRGAFMICISMFWMNLFSCATHPHPCSRPRIHSLRTS